MWHTCGMFDVAAKAEVALVQLDIMPGERHIELGNGRARLRGREMIVVPWSRMELTRCAATAIEAIRQPERGGKAARDKKGIGERATRTSIADVNEHRVPINKRKKQHMYNDNKVS
ncbi:hypothetical protein ZWY2020_033985 [Hordeum vulgare]|nr:hypothetical protein ZWY2020_033985 [Hordeum vulgare]